MSSKSGVSTVDGQTGDVVLAALGVPKTIPRTTDQTVNNSVTLVNDDTMSFAVGATDMWFVEVFCVVSAASTAADFKFAFAGPTGMTGYMGAVGLPNTNIQSWAPTTSGNTPFGTGLSSPTSGLAFGLASGTIGNSLAAVLIMDGSHSGTVNFQWAQNTATAENTTLKKGSWMRATRLA